MRIKKKILLIIFRNKNLTKRKPISWSRWVNWLFALVPESALEEIFCEGKFSVVSVFCGNISVVSLMRCRWTAKVNSEAVDFTCLNAQKVCEVISICISKALLVLSSILHQEVIILKIKATIFSTSFTCSLLLRLAPS